jgi:hypothetical protein
MLPATEEGDEDDVVKLHIAASIVAAAILTAGCAFHSSKMVLDPIGPPPLAPAPTGSTGALVVFSAFEQGAEFNSPRYRRQYSDYKLLSTDGRLVQTIRNDAGELIEGPKRVEVPVGTYHIIARANSYGQVSVPIVIRANQVTTVHLEGSPSWPNGRQLAGSNPVRLPDGNIAGWRAGADTPSKP